MPTPLALLTAAGFLGTSAALVLTLLRLARLEGLVCLMSDELDAAARVIAEHQAALIDHRDDAGACRCLPIARRPR